MIQDKLQNMGMGKINIPTKPMEQQSLMQPMIQMNANREMENQSAQMQ